MALNKIWPFSPQVPIVDERGNPTPYFNTQLQLLLEASGIFEGDIETINVTLEDKADKSIVLTAGVGLDGGGDLSANRTFDLNASLGDLNNVDTSGAASGNVLTYDGSQWEPAAPSGGGGGSATAHAFAYNTLVQTSGTDNLYVSNQSASAMNASASSSDNLSVTFTVGATTKVLVTFSAIISRATGRTRIKIADSSGTVLFPKHTSGITGTIAQYSVLTGEGTGHMITLNAVIEFAAGTHTVVVKAEHAISTVATTWLDRNLSVLY